MQRLSTTSLGMLPAEVAVPTYDRSSLRTGIVHLGVSAFFRGHGAAFTEAAIKAGDLRWGVTGASLRSPDIRDALAPQDGLYTLAAREDASETLQVIGLIREVHVASEAAEPLLAAMSDADVAIVSTTVTEKGYCLHPATGLLDVDHPDILHDLTSPHMPRSALGFLIEALARRRASGAGGFTVLCCDNLARNGATLGEAVRTLARLRDSSLAHFIEDQVSFPSTMLDRIVPATTPADRAGVSERLGVRDAAPVVAERHCRWVVEDLFVCGRPRWEDVGVELVDDVAPYETIKLKLLNASHSALAYLGYLAGHETIADASHDPPFLALVRDMMTEEVMPTLRLPAGINASAFRDETLARFRNRAIAHRTWQIAMDGSQKLPPRLLGTIRDRLVTGAPFPRLALAVAGWVRYASGVDERGRPIDVRDPLATRFARLAKEAGGNTDALADGFLKVAEVFGTDLPRDTAFAAALRTALRSLYEKGARNAVAAACEAGA